MNTHDRGPEFEVRALSVARAIHDPSGLQGAIMFEGREHDGVFSNDTTVVAFEFTQDAKKAKAEKDAEKLARVLKHLRNQPEHRFKAAQGYFVTEGEPTAEQRQAVDRISKRHGVSVNAMSVLTLRRQLIDSEEYIRVRLMAPFGSTAYKLAASPATRAGFERYVEPTLCASGEQVSLEAVLDQVRNGSSCVLIADFGAGKSAALRELFVRMRKRHFKAPMDERLPVHINLRDCYGLRSPAEILRRHSEEIGFQNERSLIAAWRAGACNLLLDGFDELVPARWVGGARDLSNVRWQALEAVRRLVAETPAECGLVIAGRPQYFSSTEELRKALGLGDQDPIVEVRDFDQSQVEEFLGTETNTVLPEWVPSRPFLLLYLAQSGLLETVTSQSDLDAGHAWPQMIDVLSDREAARVSSITPSTARALLARVATMARASEDGLGPVSLADMRAAFTDVCGYEVDEDGLQLLLRLPGLASVPTSGPHSESRTFVDRALADAAYGLDLSSYVMDPFGQHPLADGASWTAVPGTPLAAEVAIVDMQRNGFDPAFVLNGITRRMDLGRSDAILFDLVTVADKAEIGSTTAVQPFFSDMVIGNLSIGSGGELLAASVFRDCLIEVLDVSEVEDSSTVPQFEGCLIGRIDGWAAMPEDVQSRFRECDVEAYSAPAATTAGLMELLMPVEDRLALVILKKVYAQAGSGRKVTSLGRGLPPAERGEVESVLEQLVALGWIQVISRRSEELALPVKGKRAVALQILATPAAFSLEQLRQERS